MLVCRHSQVRQTFTLGDGLFTSVPLERREEITVLSNNGLGHFITVTCKGVEREKAIREKEVERRKARETLLASHRDSVPQCRFCGHDFEENELHCSASLELVLAHPETLVLVSRDVMDVYEAEQAKAVAVKNIEGDPMIYPIWKLI